MVQSLWVQIETKIREFFQNPEAATAGTGFASSAQVDGALRECHRQFSSLEAGYLESAWERGSVADFAQVIQQDTLRSLQRESIRSARQEILSSNAQLNRLAHLMLLALQSGNIGFAMMLFSHLEARSANELTRVLMEKVRSLQERKRELGAKIQEQKNDFEGNKAIQQIKNDMEQTNDDITLLQTFIREVAQNKQQMLELANGFLTKEHETTMSIVRGFAR
jgi:hypothetical protein